MKVKMVLTLPSKADADKLIDAVKTQVIGRYGKTSYFATVLLPSPISRNTCGWLKGDTRYSIYDVDAAEVEPVFISVIDSLAQFGFLTYDFRLNGKSIGADWWKPTDEELLSEGYSCSFESTDEHGKVCYDDTAANCAAMIYLDKLSKLESGVKKTA